MIVVMYQKNLRFNKKEGDELIFVVLGNQLTIDSRLMEKKLC